MKFKNNILKLLEERGITVEQFVEKNKLCFKHINALCDGTIELKSNDIKHFAELLNVTPADIIAAETESADVCSEDVDMLNSLSVGDRVIVRDLMKRLLNK